MKKELLIQSLIGLILGGGLVYLSYLLVSDNIIEKFYASDSLFIISFSIISAIFTAIFIHEFGHLLTGIIQGFQIELFVVGFLGIHRQGGKLKFFFNKDFQYFGGVTATSPKRKITNIRKRYALIVAGGPLFSLLAGFLLLLIFNHQDSILNAFIASTGFISILLFFATTIPDKSGTFFTDRKRFQRLLDNGKDGAVELALLETINQNFIDGNCKEIELEKLETIKKDSEPFIQFWGYYFEYHFLLDTQKPIPQLLLDNLKGYEKYFSKAVWKSLNLNEK